ncbi:MULTISPECIES: restriction endonuclease subunit S [Pseudomonas]|uniref:restriction endonuclease subunit S n=1 Tax=Pseudomonas TaxID=286 RepID=UPI000C88C851|nr:MULTISPECIES: restriction endonuclease subunit S [Pseudomonas]PMZ72693.1 hypothetical protein C1X25_10580 [Pseudomonas sp. GW247-3R2A]PMY72472.1 hypothetical protein C1X26_14000 [Pseudomonas sp. MPR-R3A]PMY97809.1 hypothetical protein C1X24_12675 [Pseudomonas sp. FW305-124]PNA91948.1 hypothetical protein C1X23_16010 [Pseudomonas sp. FW300-E2]PNB02603.1 hypothetical protein C1X27_12490 [Pseudomonas sp. MPR-AND1B]
MNWKIRPLGDCISLRSGSTPSKQKPEFWSGNVPWASSKELKELRIYDTESRVTKAAIKSKNSLIDKGTVLIVVRGMVLAKEFPVSVAQVPMTFNQDLKAVDPKDGIIDRAFLPYLLLGHREALRSLADEAAHGTKRIQTDRLLAYQVALPSLEAQKYIASILSTYDDLIENNKRRIKILEEIARRLYENWFVHFRFPGHEEVKLTESELGLIPEGWRIAPIKETYFDLYDGPHATPKKITIGPIFLGIKNIKPDGGLDLSSVQRIADADFPKWTKRVTPQEGDIVFSYEATLNRYAIIPRDFHGCLGRRLALIRPISSFRCFLYMHFFSGNWREVVSRNTLSGATVDRIPLSKFPEFPLLLPPEAMAGKFEELCHPILSLIEGLTRKNTNLRAQRDLLLPKLVSGAIDVSDISMPT